MPHGRRPTSTDAGHSIPPARESSTMRSTSTLAASGSINTLMGITRHIREELVFGHEYMIVEMGAFKTGSIREPQVDHGIFGRAFGGQLACRFLSERGVDIESPLGKGSAKRVA